MPPREQDQSRVGRIGLNQNWLNCSVTWGHFSGKGQLFSSPEPTGGSPYGAEVTKQNWVSLEPSDGFPHFESNPTFQFLLGS